MENQPQSQSNPDVKFNYHEFSQNKTVDYLKTHILTHADREKIFGEFFTNIHMQEESDGAQNDFEYIKYMIDCYGEGKYDWGEMFDLSQIFDDCGSYKLLPMICSECTEEIILYTLDVCDKYNLNMEIGLFVNTHDSLLSMLCSFTSRQTDTNYLKILNRALDIFIGKNLRLDDIDRCSEDSLCLCPSCTGNGYGVCKFMFEASQCEFPEITKRALDLYIERKIIFDNDTLELIGCHEINGDNCMYQYLMNTEREVFE